MRVFVQTGYGSADVIVPSELQTPLPGAGEVVVGVRAASISAGDRFLMRGKPFPARLAVGWPTPKKDHVVGLDFAGTISAVGSGVTGFEVGDAVYGECRGACAEYARADAARIAHAPRSLTFEQASAVPTSGVTALQALRDQARVRPGQKVLINGASGGVGTFAVQIAKASGAEVTGVCSARNAEMVRSLGADHVIDYTREDFTAGGPRYDVIIDNVASHSLSRARRALTRHGVHIPVSGHAGMRWILAAALSAPFVRRQGRPLVASTNAGDLAALAELIDDGKVRPVVETVYALEQTLEAFRRLDAEHARGKIVITVE